MGWQEVAAALASPRDSRPSDKRLPVAELASVFLGIASAAELARLFQWVGGTEVQARAAVLSVVGASPCALCSGLGLIAVDVTCTRCEGAGLVNPGERAVAELLGVSRHAFRRDRAYHDERVAKVVQLMNAIDDRLRGV